MKVTDEEKWKEIGYAKLCMNFVQYQVKMKQALYILIVPRPLQFELKPFFW